jgi:hypothetical protein
MLANFKRTIQVSVLLSALAASAVGAVGVAGIAYAAPNFERVFESPYSQLLLAHKSATPASGNYDNAVQPVKISMQNEGAFTNVIAPSFPNSTGNVIRTAQSRSEQRCPTLSAASHCSSYRTSMKKLTNYAITYDESHFKS